MRILTVRQPWAWAIIHAGKDVENRTRNLAGDYRGPVAIHVSKQWAEGWRSSKLERAMYHWALTHPEVHDESTPNPWWLDQGAIIGVVDLADVHTSEERSCARLLGIHESGEQDWAVGCSEWAEQDRVHLVLANPRPLREPYPYRGALHLQTPNAAETAEILRRVQ